MSHNLQYFPSPFNRPEIVLPQFVSPLPPRFLRDDLEYLQKKGVFVIPEAGLRNELLRTYVQYVHPYAPVLDLEEFLSVIEKDDGSNPISLLIFQAVMFAATAYVDLRHLTAQGYDNRKSARKAFFQRAKLLYDFDFELDRQKVVQAVMLMTYWYENPDDPKDVWHWLGVGISLARTIGLNCDTSTSDMSPQKRRLWKRIWWSLYTRDRLVAIGMRRPMRIKGEDFDVPMLELEDFETSSMPPELCRMLGNCPAVKDTSKRETLAKMCIEMAALCQCITHVLTAQYSILGHKLGATQETTMRLVPRKSAADAYEVIRCDGELNSWYEKLPRELRYFTADTHEKCNSNDGEVVHVHKSILTGVYLTAISALHRPQIMPSAPNLVVAPELQELSRRKVREAANDITDMFKDLYGYDLIRYLPNTGVTVLLPAIMIHLLNIKSSDATLRQTSIRKFQFCMQALQRLREMYASADFAFSFLDAVVQKTDLHFVPPTTNARSQLASNTMKFKQKQAQKGSVLTPPPEAVHLAANHMLFASTLAEEEKQLLAAFTTTPPASEKSLNPNTTGGSAISLLDLGQLDEGESMHEHIEDFDLNQEMELNDFDNLINLEEGADLFTSKDGLCADLNINLGTAWTDTFSPAAAREGETLGDKTELFEGVGGER